MEWIVKIQNKPELRIVVKFDAKQEQLIFTGQYKPHGRNWMDFNEEKYSIYIITAEIIQELLIKIYDKLKKILDAYNEINEGFGLIKLIS